MNFLNNSQQTGANPLLSILPPQIAALFGSVQRPPNGQPQPGANTPPVAPNGIIAPPSAQPGTPAIPGTPGGSPPPGATMPSAPLPPGAQAPVPPGQADLQKQQNLGMTNSSDQMLASLDPNVKSLMSLTGGMPGGAGGPAGDAMSQMFSKALTSLMAGL